MSHDRGCWKCGDDRPYDDCKREDCPKRREDCPKKQRESVISWSDAKFLHRKLNECQEELMAFAASGFKKTGFNDDQRAIMSMIEVRNLIEKFIEKSKKVNDKKW